MADENGPHRRVARYSRHARERMQQRSIAPVEVEYVLEHFEIEYADRDGNRILVGHPNGRYIKVVIRGGSDPPFIITTAD